jgi:hypothetical protein
MPTHLNGAPELTIDTTFGKPYYRSSGHHSPFTARNQSRDDAKALG